MGTETRCPWTWRVPLFASRFDLADLLRLLLTLEHVPRDANGLQPSSVALGVARVPRLRRLGLANFFGRAHGGGLSVMVVV